MADQIAAVLVALLILLTVVLISPPTALMMIAAGAAMTAGAAVARAAGARAAGGAPPAAADAAGCAWVTLVMRGDAYVGGALTMAYSMRMAGTRAALVCMVTDDVSEAARTQLRLVFDAVVPIPTISYACKPLKTQKQRDMYDWVSDGFTKWACLDLTQYRRVCFIDADKIAVGNCDDIFALRAPAATFSSPWAQPFMRAAGAASARGRGRGMYNPYQDCVHGGVVPRRAIEAGFTRDSFVAIGTMMLLEPAAGLLAEFRAFVESQLPFGEPGCYSMMDEQSITKFYYERRTPWHFIHQRYNYIPWQRAWLPDVRAPPARKAAAVASRPDQPRPQLLAEQLRADRPRIFHYFGKKVWLTPRSEWPDAEAWWRFACALVRAHPGAAPAFDAQLLALAPTASCAWCQSDGVAADHDLVDGAGRIVCERMLGGA